MKKFNILLVLVAMFFAFGTKAQQTPAGLQTSKAAWVDKISDPSANVYEAKQAFEAYWADKDVSDKHITKGKGYKVFQRWSNFMAPRVFPSGNKYNPSLAYTESQQFQANFPSNRSASGAWTFLGPAHPTGSVANGSYTSPGGSGRIACIAIDPANTNNLWVGTPAGGLWKSTDGGTTWSTNFDQMAVLGVSSIVIDPTNSNNMYIATGDGDAGDTYSVGILKSTDKGATWSTTGFSVAVSQAYRLRKLVMDPNNPSKMYAASNAGLLMTTDGWATYTTAVASVSFYDIELKPADPTNVYAVGVASNVSKFYKSTNSGTSFALAGTGLPTSGVQRLAIAVSAAANTKVWALAGKSSDQGFYGFFTSSDGGATFTTTYNSTSANHNLLGWETNFSDAGGQAFYDLTLAVNPTNANEMFIGGVNLQKSTNGGTSWTCNGYWLSGSSYQYVHADHHAIEYVNGTTVLNGNDGGIFKTSNNGTTWTDISNNLAIAQVARFGTSSTNPNLIMTGMQDNGTNKYNGTTWSIVYGGDGCEALCTPGTDATVYASYVYGAIYRSTNGGTSWTSIKASTESGAWIVPFVMHPTTYTTLYAGYTNLYKSTNSGTAWTKKGTAPGSGEIINIALAPSATTTIYIIKEYWNGSSNTYTVGKTINDGTAWTNISTGLPVTTAAPTYIAVSPTDANTFWITFSGYSAGNKVFKTTDGGATYTNVSGNLPNLPVNCVTYQNNTSNGTYVGTDAGVYYKDDNLSNWVAFSTGLPNVIIKELEIYYDAVTPSNSKLRAATYGRSVWQSDLYAGVVVPVLATVTTTAASGIGQTVAVTGGNVTSDGNASVTARGVCYATTSNPTLANSFTSNGTGTGVFTSNLSGLTLSTTYYVRAYATNSVGTAYGSQISFTTSATAPVVATVTTTAASAITYATATSGGNVTSDGGATVTARGVCYATTSAPTIANSKTVDGSGTGVFTSNLTGLSASTTYYVRAYATNSVGTSYGSEVSFTTSAAPTGASVPFTEAFAGTTLPTGWLQINSSGVTDRWTVSATATAGGAANEMKCTYLQVNPGTTQLVTPAINTVGYSSLTFSFKHMLDAYAAGVTLKVQTSNDKITWTDAWSVATSATNIAAATQTVNLTTNLNNGTTYIALTATGDLYQIDYWYIDNVSLTAPTAATAPVVSTTAVSAVTSTTATTGGNVTSDGGASVTARGVCYATTANPTTANSIVAGGTGTGIFTSNLTGLTASTTYYVRAYATNSVGTSYGTQVSFTTSAAGGSTSDVTIGTGTSTQEYPLGCYYGYERSASIYTVAELTKVGSISKVAWYPTVTTTTSVPIKIYMKHTTAATITKGTWASAITGATLVYSGTMAGTTASAWKEFVLTTAFSYTGGTNNLMVLVEANYGGGGVGTSTGAGIRYTSATSKHEYWRADNSAPTGNGTVTANRPNVKITITTTSKAVAMAINTVNEKLNVSVYPNPAVDFINVEFSSEVENAQVRIFSMTGKEVMKSEVNGNSENINISRLPAGVYVIKVITNGNMITKKFNKN